MIDQKSIFPVALFLFCAFQYYIPRRGLNFLAVGYVVKQIKRLTR